MVAQDAGDDHARDLLRCTKLSDMWRSTLRGGLKTAEEAMLWSRLSCDRVLKGQPLQESMYPGIDDREGREKTEKVR